ncbi:VWA domain-containing protein [Acidobacteria bacterium AB60]|nr:VWA domain-containing protein [Acidobacteria bacterium AB60]
MTAKRLLSNFFIALALATGAPGQSASGRISIQGLEHLLSSVKGKGDAEQARQIGALQLTERLSTVRYEQMRAQLAGEKSRQALLALADESAFLAPPPGEIPATAAPEQADQRRMLALTVRYLAKTLPLLPNLFATRETTRLEGRPDSAGEDIDASLRSVSRTTATVYYRDGHEFLDTSPLKTSKPRAMEKGLTTWGEFGPILGTVVMDAAKSQLAWSHWELNGAALLAVFRYSVPKEKSHYDIRFCCVTESYGMEVKFLSQRSGYHGEITLDPDSGTILRVTVIADLEPENPIAHAALLVEYGPVDLGGKPYLCPVRGIALALAPESKAVLDTFAQRQTATSSNTRATVASTSLPALTHAPRQVFLNDVAFRNYHLFHTDLRILSHKEEQQLAANHTQPNPPSSAENTRPAEVTVAATPPADAPAASSEVAAETPPSPPPAPEIPEVYVTGAGSLPDKPALSTSAESSTPYRISARLVDVSLVALDKKGRPVTNLDPAGIEVYDNGVKVDLRSFSSPASVAAKTTASGTPAPAQPAFSNRPPAPDNPAPAEAQNTLILLIDNSLSIDDFVNVREQLVRFLRGLHDNERVAVYVMNRGSFQLLQEVTTDHQPIADLVAKWTPSAANTALAQEQEARNRQAMEYVHNTEDLLSVNGGRSVADRDAQVQALDPQLRELGDAPGQDALSALVFLARHLATIAGHKNLIWIASDNVLADWTSNSIEVNVGSRNIEPAALHAQEAMNEAHVSVYPLDASRLEAGGIGANIGERNVQLNPTATANQVGSCGAVTAGSRAGQAGAAGMELTLGGDINTCGKELAPGRVTAQMQQDLHSIQGVYREIADATGGQAFRRASDLIREFDDVAAYGRATYQLSFAPPQAADDKYHLISIKIPGQKKVDLRYRKGYFYRQESTSLKNRFRDVAMQPDNVAEIGLTANLVPDSQNRTVRIGIAAADLAVAQKDSLWTDKLDVFLVQRPAAGMKAQVSGQSIYLRLHSPSYQKYMRDGIPFDQQFELAPGTDSIRIIVLDENSGRMGSVTIPVHPGKSA